MTKQLMLFKAESPQRDMMRQAARAFQRPSSKFVYIGGYFNMLGEYQNASTSSLLHSFVEEQQWAKVEILSLAIGDKDEEKAFQAENQRAEKQYHDEKRIVPTSYTEMIVDKAFLPKTQIKRWQRLSSPQNLRREMDAYFSRMNMLSYSHGHRVVQELDISLRDRLTCAHLPVDSLCRVSAINLAPAGPPVPDGLIQQLSLIRRTDKYMHPVFYDLLFSDFAEDYSIRFLGNTTCVGENVADNTINTVTKNDIPDSLAIFGVIIDSSGHSLWNYINPPVFLQDNKKILYTNSAIGAICREVAQQMLGASGGEFSFKKTEILSHLLSPENGEYNKKILKKWCDKHASRFNRVVKRYILADRKSCESVVEKEIAAVKRLNMRPPFIG